MESTNNSYNIIKEALNTANNCYDQGLPNKFYCKVKSVYDGDTFTIIACYASCPEGKVTERGSYQLGQFQVRMFGYDSPEMKQPKSAPNREENHAKALKAKQTLSDLVLNKIILLERKMDRPDKVAKEKYGRILAIAYTVDQETLEPNTKQSLNDFMIENGHGYPYEGGTKKKE